MVFVVVAVDPSQMSVVGWVISIQALFASILDVLVTTIVPSDLLVLLTDVLSEDSITVVSEVPSLNSAQSDFSLLEGSDGLGSGIKDEPLIWISWVVVSLVGKVVSTTPSVLEHGDGSVSALS